MQCACRVVYMAQFGHTMRYPLILRIELLRVTDAVIALRFRRFIPSEVPIANNPFGHFAFKKADDSRRRRWDTDNIVRRALDRGRSHRVVLDSQGAPSSAVAPPPLRLERDAWSMVK